MGPNARGILEKVTSDDVSNAAFPFGRVPDDQDRRRAGAGALRITYVGELGWELHVPTKYRGDASTTR